MPRNALLDHQQLENMHVSKPMENPMRSKLSCETWIVEFVKDVLVMDFSKTFGKVGHGCLFAKLQD